MLLPATTGARVLRLQQRGTSRTTCDPFSWTVSWTAPVGFAETVSRVGDRKRAVLLSGYLDEISGRMCGTTEAARSSARPGRLRWRCKHCGKSCIVFNIRNERGWCVFQSNVV